ncbi:hypothetical protein [Saccharothrix sp. Mg75]|uniref:hypothetical protein n=1 Tax=Saccharothrix sp. Mg75 TaxID=3445357 RepID=UPI003EE995FA
MDQSASSESRPRGPGSELSLPVRSHHDVVLLCPAGRLDLSTYARLRDGLLKHMIEQPQALIVVLGPGFEIGSGSMTSVFVSVWTRCQSWSSTPLLLAATTAGHRRMLARNGIPRFLPCHDGVPAALDAVGDPPPRQRDQALLPLDTDTDHLARDFTRRTCRAWEGLHEVTPSTALLAGELAGLARSTAIPGTVLILLLERRPEHLAVAVRYFGAARPATAPDLTRTRRLSTASGTVHTPDGHVLWATVSLNRPPRRPDRGH